MEKVSSLAICETGHTMTGMVCQYDQMHKQETLDSSFLVKGMINLNQLFFTGQPWPQSLPTSPVRGKPGQIQDWYNRKVMEIGEAAEKKVTNLVVKQAIMWEMNNQLNGAKTPASGTFIHPSGQTFVGALGRDDEVNKDQKKWEELFKQIGWTNIKLNATDVEITYAVDGATQNPRSGNIVATYKVRLHFTGIYKGQPITRVRDSVMGTILIHDAKVETMDIQP